jgi:hypothetical protein
MLNRNGKEQEYTFNKNKFHYYLENYFLIFDDDKFEISLDEFTEIKKGDRVSYSTYNLTIPYIEFLKKMDEIHKYESKKGSYESTIPYGSVNQQTIKNVSKYQLHCGWNNNILQTAFEINYETLIKIESIVKKLM